MAVATPISIIAQIGQTAGIVWRTLDEQGPMSLSKLVRVIGEPRDAVMQAIGWLAREDKIWIEEDHRSRMVSLR